MTATSNSLQKAPTKTTPMMQQFLEIKEKHKDCLLFFRMGDFYELFFDDALKAAEALDIALTKRGQHNDQDIPMCGVPHHTSEIYLSRLIKKGFRVAICEQMEDPQEAKKRGYKAVVKRDVVRVVTPGTITEENLLDSKKNNYIAAIFEQKNAIGVSWVDVSTGEIFVETTSSDQLNQVISRLLPSEIIIADSFFSLPHQSGFVTEWEKKLTILPKERFDYENGLERLKNLYEITTLDSFGKFNRHEITAAGLLLDYVVLNTHNSSLYLKPLKKLASSEHLLIDPSTRRNLEILQTIGGSRKGSLLDIIDMTKSAGGSRKLSHFLSSPLTNSKKINARLDLVECFFKENDLRNQLRDYLKKVADIERSLTNIIIQRSNPKDLMVIREGLNQARLMHDLLSEKPNPKLGSILNLYHEHDLLIKKLSVGLNDTLPHLARDGGMIAPGYSKELDQFKQLKENSRQLILKLEQEYREKTQLNGLKIKNNNILGYFIEITQNQSKKIIENDFLIHRQTLASSIRYTSQELIELEQNIKEAEEKALSFELDIYRQFQKDIISYQKTISSTIQFLNFCDVFSSLAELALYQNYQRPLIDDSCHFDIKAGRHPVVEKSFSSLSEDSFIANNCNLSKTSLEESHIWLITGPNMAGKSTFLRQNALIVILAQMGSFVPADYAHIGIVDKIFSRVGASDDLAKGHSTFMVEMIETSSILNQATEKSLVILDEIGRGTATFDGLSIAWSCLEYLDKVNKSRALFATHYHELTQLSTKYPSIHAYTMNIKEWEGKIIFLHEVIEGSADKSYGIHVAEIAGLPKAAVERAKTILDQLENDKSHPPILTEPSFNLPLFTTISEKKEENDPQPSEIEEELRQLSLDSLTPLKALNYLYELKEKLQD